MSRLVRFNTSPLPEPGQDLNGWASTLIASLDETFSQLQFVLAGITAEFTTGNVSLTSKSLTGTFTAAETLTAGQVCYLNSSSQMALADADAAATSKGLLGISKTALATGESGVFLLRGIYTTSGLSNGEIQYLSTTAGEWLNSHPTATGDILRVLGYAITSTQFFFNPDETWLEIA